MKLKCPECGEMKRKIALAGHLLLVHGYSVKEANQKVKDLEAAAR